MDLILATSLAGHDKKQVYVVVNQDDEFCMLVNGTTKTMAKPKKKKKIHLRLIKNIPSYIYEEIEKIDSLDDVAIKRILRSYNRRNEDV